MEISGGILFELYWTF